MACVTSRDIFCSEEFFHLLTSPYLQHPETSVMYCTIEDLALCCVVVKESKYLRPTEPIISRWLPQTRIGRKAPHNYLEMLDRLCLFLTEGTHWGSWR
jgi:hypothetical protein